MAQEWIEHLGVLRRTLLIYASVFLLICAPFLYYAAEWYALITYPLMRYLPEAHAPFIATEVTAPFMVPLKLALISTFFLTLPILLYLLWRFIAVGLYSYERRQLVPYLFACAGLFYLGAGMAYGIVCPMAFHFFYSAAPNDVLVITEISYAVNFVLSMCWAFGLCFQMPLVVWFALANGLVQPQQLAKARPYIIVASFVIGMVLTPPDVLSQIMLAIPMWLLFELALWLSPVKQNAQPSHSSPTPEHQ